MSVTGLCAICEARQASEQCRGCGSLVCRQHYRERKGLCAECVADADPSSGGPDRRF